MPRTAHACLIADEAEVAGLVYLGYTTRRAGRSGRAPPTSKTCV